LDASLRNAVDWKVLLGFLSEGDANNFVAAQGFELPPEKSEEIKAEIKEAISYVSGISGRRHLKPEIKEIPQRFQPHLQQVSKQSTFPETHQGMKSWSFGMVEIRTIHCFQQNINLEYIEQLLEKTPAPDDPEGTLEFCLPSKGPEGSPVLVGYNQNTFTYSVVSENLDLRILGNIQGEDPVTKRKFLGFGFGGGLRQMSVVEYQGVYMIKNGYHRAYALAKKGHTYMPCLVVKTDSYLLTGANAPGFFPVDLMTSDKSPIIDDFFSKAAVNAPRRRLRVVLTIHGEAQVIPT